MRQLLDFVNHELQYEALIQIQHEQLQHIHGHVTDIHEEIVVPLILNEAGELVLQVE
jgi:hypothetical protein